jgi:hypothetical protein
MRICNKKSDIVGLLLYGGSTILDTYAANYNKRSREWIDSGFFQHIHLCCGSDMVIAVLALSAHDIFGNLSSTEVNDATQFNRNADQIKLRITEIARNRVPFVFSFAKETRYIYGSAKESKIHMELSWLLVGRKSYGKRHTSGILPILYDLFTHNPTSKTLLQIIVPDGSINYTTNKLLRYWDIKFHISSCGKVEPGESNLTAIIRETQEEIDLDISHKTDHLTETEVDGINLYFCKVENLQLSNYFEKEYAEWQSYIYCKSCRDRYFAHKPPSTVLNSIKISEVPLK